MTDPIYSDPDFVQFYDIENQSGRADFEYCIGLAVNRGSVLDLGCGTGQLAAELADGHSVTGVDPASAMLDVARRRAGGDRVDWVEAARVLFGSGGVSIWSCSPGMRSRFS